MRAVLSIVGTKHRSEYYEISERVEAYLDMLRHIKRDKKRAILSFGMELESQHLKNEITRTVSRMKSNMESMQEFSSGEMSAECVSLMQLSIFRDDYALYLESNIEERYYNI